MARRPIGNNYNGRGWVFVRFGGLSLSVYGYYTRAEDYFPASFEITEIEHREIDIFEIVQAFGVFNEISELADAEANEQFNS